MGFQKHEIDALAGITKRQREMLIIIYEYDEGWIDEVKLEKKLEELFKKAHRRINKLYKK